MDGNANMKATAPRRWLHRMVGWLWWLVIIARCCWMFDCLLKAGICLALGTRTETLMYYVGALVLCPMWGNKPPNAELSDGQIERKQ